MKGIGIIILVVIAAVALVAALSYTYIGTAWYHSIESANYQRSQQQAQQQAQQRAEWALQQNEREAVSEQIIASWKAAIPIFWGLASFTVVALALVMIYVSARAGQAVVIKAETWARSISVDPRTGQLPGYLNNKIFVDPNTGLVMTTDKPAPPNPQLAQGAMAIRAAGVVSRNSRQAPSYEIIESKTT